MASLKVKFRPSFVTGQEGVIYYQIIHERKVRQLLTDYRVFPCEWDEKRPASLDAPEDERLSLLLSIRKDIRHDIERFKRIAAQLDHSGLAYTIDDLTDAYKSYTRRYSLFNYMEDMIECLRKRGKTRTSETYRSALNSFQRYRNNKDLMLDCITAETMESYEAWLKKQKLTANTISFYAGILRAVYNRAVDQKAIEDRKPFRHVYTGVDKTIKRALPLSMIKRILLLDLHLEKRLDFARDMFLMSFYLRGMSFIDMAFLKKTDLCDGYVTYRRHKTGQLLTIAWTKEMQQTIDKYPENDSCYLFPILTGHSDNERNAYRYASSEINRGLKRVGQKLGIGIPLSLYVARHSWASAALSKGVPINVISEGLGHDSEATTRIYLSTLDTSPVDRANSLILRSLR